MKNLTYIILFAVSFKSFADIDKDTSSSRIYGMDAEVKVLVSSAQVEDAKVLERTLKKLGYFEKVESQDVRKTLIYFWDTPSADLYKSDIIIRSRDVDNTQKDQKFENTNDDLTLKIRGLNVSDVTPAMKDLDGAKIEYDKSGDKKSKLSFSVTKELSKKQTRQQLIEGMVLGVDSYHYNDPRRKLIPTDWKKIINNFSNKKVNYSEVIPLRPVYSLRWKTKERGEEISVELWVLEKDVRFLELSVKSKMGELEDSRDKLKSIMKSMGIEESSKSQSKTAVYFNSLFPDLKSAVSGLSCKKVYR
jgi:hypothetical protein